MVKKSGLILILYILLLNLVSAEEIIQTQTIRDFQLINFIPTEFNVGDVQFNLQIKNTGTEELKNVIGIVSGNGFSTYNLVPIDSLKPEEKSYLLVMGNLKEAGNVTLTIKINDKTFYQDIVVKDPNLNNIQLEQKKNAELEILSKKLLELKDNYTNLETDYNSKKGKYDLSTVNLNDLKLFIRDAESSILSKNPEKANVSLTLGLEEYKIQIKNIENVKPIKKSSLSWFKDNILIFSTIAASIITLFSFYELMKKKKETVSQKVTETIKDVKNKIEKKE